MDLDGNRYKDLSQHEVTELKNACVLILEAVRRSGVSWVKLAEELSVAPETLTTFVQRSRSGTASHTRRSETLAAISAYVMRSCHALPPAAKAIFAQKIELFQSINVHFSDASSDVRLSDIQDEREVYEALVDYGYDAVRTMLKIPSANYEEDCQRLCGTYLAYRHSIYREHILVSAIEFRTRPHGRQWEFRTAHWDRMRERKGSDGMVLPIHGNVYLSGDVERGQGLDIFVLRMPLQTEISKIIGFQITIDNDKRPLFSRTMLVRSNFSFEQLDNEYSTLLSVRSKDQVLQDPDGDLVVEFFENDPVKKVLRADARYLSTE